MNLTAAASTFGSPFKTHQHSPPRVTTGWLPYLGTGLAATPKPIPLLCTSPSIQGPITIIAAWPPMNWSPSSGWLQFMQSFETDPFFTRSTQSCNACLAGSVVKSSKLPPLVQTKGSHCQVACSSFGAEIASPYTGDFVSFPESSFSSSQVFGGSVTPASFNIFLL